MADFDVTTEGPVGIAPSAVDWTPVANRQQSAIDHLQMGIPGAVAGFVDTLGQSVGAFDDEDMAQALQSANDTFGDYYANNREVLRGVGDAVGMFVPGTIAVKGLKWTSQAAKGVLGNTALTRNLLHSGKTLNQLTEAARLRSLKVAAQGIDPLTDTGSKLGYVALKSKAKTASIADGIKEAVAFELGIAATMNESEFLYPDEFATADILALNAAGVAVGGAIDYFAAGRAFRAISRGYAPTLSKGLNPANVDLKNIVFQENRRDIGIAMLATAASAQRAARDTATKPLARDGFASAVQQTEKEIQEQFMAMGKDVPIRDVHHRVDLSPKQTENLRRSLEENPASLLGVHSLENLPRAGNLAELDNARNAYMTKLREQQVAERAKKKPNADTLRKLRREHDLLSSEVSIVLERDGTHAFGSQRAQWFHDQIDAGSASMSSHTVSGIDARRVIDKSNAFSLEVTESSLVRNGKSVKLEDLGFYDRTAAYYALDDMSTKYKDFGVQHRVTDATPLHKLEFLQSVMEKHRGKINNNFVLDASGRPMTLDDIAFAALDKKFADYKKLRAQSLSPSALKLPPHQQLTEEKITRMLNLPALPYADRSPMLDVFESVVTQGDETFRGAFANLDHVRRQLQSVVEFPKLSAYTSYDAKVTGNMVRMDKERSPVVMRLRMLPDNTNTIQDMQTLAYQQRSEVLNTLERGHDLVSRTVNMVRSMAQRGAAESVEELAEGVQRNFGYFNTASFANGESRVLQAADQLEAITTRQFRREVSARLESIIGDSFAKLRSNQYAADREMLNMAIHARRMGWDLEETTEQLAANQHAFKLSKTQFNRERYRELFGVEMPDDALMPAMVGRQGTPQPVVVSDLALQGMTAVSATSKDILGALNTLGRAHGRSEFSGKAWHVPPINMARGHRVYLIDDTGKMIGMESAATEKVAFENARRALANDDRNLHIIREKDMEVYFDMRDRAFTQMRNYSDTLAQTGKAKGTSVSNLQYTGEQVLDDVIDSINSNYESILRRTRAMVFEPQVRYAKMRYNASASVSDAAKKQTVWQQYIRSIYGNNQLTPNDVVGKVYGTIEGLFDDVLETLWDRTTGRRAASHSKQATELYESLSKQLGDYNPFKDAEDYVQRTAKLSSPYRSKQIAGKLNNITSLLTLRLFEVGHALLNMTSLAATAPAVVASLRPLKGESELEWRSRIGAFGSVVKGDVAMFNPTRAIATAFDEVFKGHWNKRWKQASDMGYFDQEVAELVRSFAVGHESMGERMVSQYGKWTTYLSDKSEELSRAFSFVLGDTIARRGLGITDDKHAFAYAHHFANQVIGDYRSTNRPRIFQGAVGMPLGLFTTFMWNYYERLFGYIERKDLRTLAVQYGTQTSVFGANTVPGFEVFTNTLASNWSGDTNIVDTLEQKFGREYTDWFFYGTLSNLPKLFGAEDGISLYTRADMNVQRVPGIWSADQAPAINVIRSMYGAMSDAVTQMQRVGLNGDQIAEIVARYSPNRTLKNVLEVYSGNSTDRSGALIASDVNEGMSLAARAFGMRSLNEQVTRDKMFQMRTVDLSQRAKMSDLRQAIRSRIRSGKLSNEDISDAVLEYIKFGGSPAYFPRWLQTQYQTATIEKAQLELIKRMKDPTQLNNTKRLINAMTWSSETNAE